MLLLSLPFYLHPTNIRGSEFSITELAIIGGVSALGLRAAGERFAGWQPALALPRPHPTDLLAAAFLVGGLLALAPSEYPKQSLRELRWLIIEPILVFYMIRITVRGSEQVVGLMWALVAAGLIATVCSWLTLVQTGTLLDPAVRAMVPYLSPNHLALFLERAGAAALAIALFGRTRWVGWLSFLTVALGIIRTLSAGAWLGLGACSLILLVLRSRRWALVAAVAIAAVIAGALVILPAERTIDRLNPATGTGLFRLEIWSSSLQMLADHPLLGVGLDNYLYLYRSDYILPQAWEEPNISHPHNWVLQFWLELGLLGLLVGFASVVFIARTAHRKFHYPVSPSDRPLAAMCLGNLVVFLVHGSVDNSYFLVDLAVVWWVVIGLLALPPLTHGEEGFDRMGDLIEPFREPVGGGALSEQ